MTTKDYIYLGLILLAAVAFYCNGFYAGVYRCKRMYDSLLDETDTPEDSAGSKPGDVKFLSSEENVLADSPTRQPKVAFSNRELRGDFGTN
jgi:hypothetical protein